MCFLVSRTHNATEVESYAHSLDEPIWGWMRKKGKQAKECMSLFSKSKTINTAVAD